MINEQTNKMIDVIRTMSEKYKLRLALCLADSNMSSISYNKKEMLKMADIKLREIDEEYRTTYVNMRKYGSVLLTTAMIIELAPEEQNQIMIYLQNSIKR